MSRVVFLQPPSPPFRNINREYAGGFGICTSRTSRLTFGHDDQPFVNVPFATAAGGVERDGHDVVFVDGQAERLTLAQTARRVASAHPGIVVMLASLPSLSWDLRTLQRLRTTLPDATLVVAGAVCAVLPGAFLDSADYVVTGEPEGHVPRVVRALAEGAPACLPGVAFKRGDRTYASFPDQRGDLDEWPDLPLHLLPLSRYRLRLFGSSERALPILTSKGCGFGCAYFCPYPLAVGSKVRFRSPSRVVDELERASETYGVRQFVFRDQNFTLKPARVTEICRGMLERRLGVEWMCETRFGLAEDEQMLRTMRSAGCRQINFGMESGDSRLFETVGKPGAGFGRLQDTIERVKRAGIAAHVHLIIGLPGESWDTVRETARVVESLGVDSVQLSNMIAYPGTRYFAEAEERGWILTHDYSRFDGSGIVVRTEDMSRASLFAARLYLRHRLLGRGSAAEIASLLCAAGSRLVERTVSTAPVIAPRLVEGRVPEDASARSGA